VTPRDDFANLSDFDLAARHLEASAEIARLEAEALANNGFEPVQVVGLPSLLWKKGARLHTTEAALAGVWAIPEIKEDPT